MNNQSRELSKESWDLRRNSGNQDCKDCMENLHWPASFHLNSKALSECQAELISQSCLSSKDCSNVTLFKGNHHNYCLPYS